MKRVTNCENIDSKAGNTIVDYILDTPFWNKLFLGRLGSNGFQLK